MYHSRHTVVRDVHSDDNVDNDNNNKKKTKMKELQKAFANDPSFANDDDDDDDGKDGTYVDEKCKDNDDQVSTSEHSEGASTVDIAEQREQQTRKSLCFAILSALGLVFLMSLIGSLMEKFSKSNNVEDDLVEAGADEAVNAAVREGATGTAQAATSGNPAM